MSRNIPKVREYLIRCREMREPTPDAWPRLFDVVYRVLAPTRLLARLNLREALGYQTCQHVESIAAARKPIGQRTMAIEESATLRYPS